MPKTYSYTFADEQLELRADRSLWWPREKVLFIADLHAGKVTHFQKAGLRLPHGSLQADLARLQQSINELKPRRVIVLGDLFHSDMNTEFTELTTWCAQQACSIELVRGNHDRFIADSVFEAGHITVHAENYQLGPFTLRHHPSHDNGYVLCGHVHPVFTVFAAGDKLRMPCFVIDERQLLLPAYGSATGGFAVKRQPGRHIIGTSPDYTELLTIQ